MRSVLFAVVALAVLAGACSRGGDADPVTSPAGLLDADEFAGYVETNPDTLVLNVHVPYAGHIGGTDEFVAFDEILDWDGLPADLDTPVAIYCRSGSMSGDAAAELAAAGYTNIIDLDGGMNAWTASGRELETNG